MGARWLVAETSWRESPVAVVNLPELAWYGTDADSGVTNWSFRSEESLNFLHLPPDREELTGAFLSVQLVRGLGEEDPDRFTARWSLESAQGTVTGAVAGEARLSNNVWELGGMGVLSGGTGLIDVYGAEPEAPGVLSASAAVAGLADGGYGAGGFVGTISLNKFGPEDDTATWQADAYINAAP